MIEYNNTNLLWKLNWKCGIGSLWKPVRFFANAYLISRSNQLCNFSKNWGAQRCKTEIHKFRGLILSHFSSSHLKIPITLTIFAGQHERLSVICKYSWLWPYKVKNDPKFAAAKNHQLGFTSTILLAHNQQTITLNSLTIWELPYLSMTHQTALPFSLQYYFIIIASNWFCLCSSVFSTTVLLTILFCNELCMLYSSCLQQET